VNVVAAGRRSISSFATLMLFSVVDDRSGAAYQECRCVYGEDVKAALRLGMSRSLLKFARQALPIE
jgi:hypothetical protein